MLKSGYLQGDEESQFFWRENTKKKFPKPLPLVYIATNQNVYLPEDGKPMIDYFTKAGFKTYKDLGIHHLNNLERFVVELHMMIDCDFYMAWGKSSIHEFVRLAVDQKLNPHHHDYIRKRSANESRHCPGDMSIGLGMSEVGQKL